MNEVLRAATASALPLLVVAGVLLAASGVPGLLLGPRSRWGAGIATGTTLAGSLLGLVGGLGSFGGAGALWRFASPMPGEQAALGTDAISAVFLLPVFLVGGLGALYGAGHAAHHGTRRRTATGPRLRFGYGVLLASLVFIPLARDGVVFLIAWEVMALANFFLITIDEEDAAVRRAGWICLLYSHVTILCLFALFVLERQLHGDFGFAAIGADAPPALRTAIFALALVAFGIKAGAMPLHSWLPAAHASAPSHVSALMSGVVIKVGVYGLVRTLALVESPPLAWGVVVLVLGSLAAFFGVVFALAQHDIKRLLAYHSIENIGIILLGLGVATIGRALARPDWIVLGMAGCLFHVWNHSLFKSLLFFGAGSVVHATGSRDLEAAGGLGRRMPWTAALFVVGSIAICGLPPLNGFVSELVVYLGLFRAAVVPGAAWAALPAPLLAATGGLAVACFVKVCGVVFLGAPRTAAAAAARESPPLLVAPMALLALLCALLGVAPGLVAPALERAISVWAGEAVHRSLPALSSLVPLGWVSGAATALVIAVALLALALAPVCRRARRRQPALPTWNCGYAASSPRLQYTASSFADLVTSRFAWALQPRVHRPRIEGLFARPAQFHSQVEDSVLDRLLLPAARAALGVTASLRALPQGQLQRYILYIVAVLVPLLIWALAGGR